MRYYIAADGGGTKLQAILYDEEMHIVSSARVSGVNSNFRPEEHIAREMRQLAQELVPDWIQEIECVSISFAGETQQLLDSLAERCTIKGHQGYGEGEVALAAAGALYGIAAQSGTGSDAFLVQPGAQDSVGGWGAVLGDEGGGYDLGVRTLKAAIYAFDGRGPRTALLDMVLEEWKLPHPWDMIEKLVGDSDYRRTIASATYLTARAAKQGDAVAISLYEGAAHELSHQVLTLIGRHGGNWQGPIVASGGTWKGCGHMFDTFRRDIQRVYPEAVVIRPFAEPVVGCAIRPRLEAGEDAGKLRDIVEERFSPFFLKVYKEVNR